jgi:hypothetical protein
MAGAGVLGLLVGALAAALNEAKRRGGSNSRPSGRT